MQQWKIIGCPCTQEYFVQHKAFYCAKLSNKQSGKVICRFDRLTTIQSKRLTSHMSIRNLSAAHAFNYIVLRVNPGLTCCEDLATALVKSLTLTGHGLAVRVLLPSLQRTLEAKSQNILLKFCINCAIVEIKQSQS